MIRSVTPGAQFTFRRRMGAVPIAAFNPATAAISAGVGVATAAIGDWMQAIQVANMGKSGATAIANELATQLSNLMQAYLATPNPTCADQRSALDAFDAAIVWLQSPAGCGNPQFGSAGDRCISERATAGAKYSYVDYYRAPIANDPRLAAAGCDTGQAVYLPNLSTGTYGNAGITSTGGSTSTGQTAEQLAAGAVTSVPAPAALPSTNTLILIGAAVVGAVVLAKVL